LIVVSLNKFILLILIVLSLKIIIIADIDRLITEQDQFRWYWSSYDC
jgi:hypothetical protein